MELASMTPIDALNTLYRLQNKLKEQVVGYANGGYHSIKFWIRDHQPDRSRGGHRPAFLGGEGTSGECH